MMYFQKDKNFLQAMINYCNLMTRHQQVRVLRFTCLYIYPEKTAAFLSILYTYFTHQIEFTGVEKNQHLSLNFSDSWLFCHLIITDSKLRMKTIPITGSL